MVLITATALVGIALASGAAVAEDVTFATPDGWVDVGPKTPAERLAGVPQVFVDVARSGRFVATAIDLAHQHGEVFSHMTAVVRDGEVRFDRDAAEFADALIGNLQKQNPSVRLRSQETVDIGGVRCARIAYDTEHSSGSPVSVLQYYMPAGVRFAVLTYSMHSDAFEGQRDVLEVAARRTGGLAEAAATDSAYRAGTFAGMLIAAFAITGLIAFLLRRRWKSALGPAMAAGVVGGLLLAAGGDGSAGEEWDSFACIVAAFVWWVVFKRRDTRAARAAVSADSAA